MYPLDGVGHYTEGVLRLLQFVEQRRPTERRFGPDADARWNGFRGDLDTADRIELMIRDADAEWPSSVGARTVFAMQGIHEDDPFGSQWIGMDSVDAEELWRKVKAQAAPTTPLETLHAIADAWGRKLKKHAAPSIEATDRLVVTGGSAIAAVIDRFAKGTGLDWTEQVVVVATSPWERQLAAAATSLLNIQQRHNRILSAQDAMATKLDRAHQLVASNDADAADLTAAQALTSR